jgi:hypothetical protein
MPTSCKAFVHLTNNFEGKNCVWLSITNFGLLDVAFCGNGGKEGRRRNNCFRTFVNVPELQSSRI